MSLRNIAPDKGTEKTGWRGSEKNGGTMFSANSRTPSAMVSVTPKLRFVILCTGGTHDGNDRRLLTQSEIQDDLNEAGAPKTRGTRK